MGENERFADELETAQNELKEIRNTLSKTTQENLRLKDRLKDQDQKIRTFEIAHQKNRDELLRVNSESARFRGWAAHLAKHFEGLLGCKPWKIGYSLVRILDIFGIKPCAARLRGNVQVTLSEVRCFLFRTQLTIDTVSHRPQPRVLEPDRGSSAQIDVIVCVHNALDHVSRCLESLMKNFRKDARLIIVDDDSDPMTSRTLKSMYLKILGQSFSRMNYAKVTRGLLTSVFAFRRRPTWFCLTAT